MKGFAHRSSARTDQSRRVREKNSDNAAAASYRAADGGTSRNGAGLFAPAPHLRDIQAMFDSENPGRSGDLAGESFAATLENHQRYTSLRSGRHAALFGLLDDIVANHIDSLAGILRGLGFDEVGTKIYRSAALSAFRAALPAN
jgi:hypothetical protein